MANTIHGLILGERGIGKTTFLSNACVGALHWDTATGARLGLALNAPAAGTQAPIVNRGRLPGRAVDIELLDTMGEWVKNGMPDPGAAAIYGAKFSTLDLLLLLTSPETLHHHDWMVSTVQNYFASRDGNDASLRPCFAALLLTRCDHWGLNPNQFGRVYDAPDWPGSARIASAAPITNLGVGADGLSTLQQLCNKLERFQAEHANGRDRGASGGAVTSPSPGQWPILGFNLNVYLISGELPPLRVAGPAKIPDSNGHFNIPYLERPQEVVGENAQIKRHHSADLVISDFVHYVEMWGAHAKQTNGGTYPYHQTGITLSPGTAAPGIA